MGAPADPRASLAALAAREPEQPGLIYFDEHQARWRWHSWRWLEEAVREVEGRRGSVGAADLSPAPADPEDSEAPVWPSVDGLVAAFARTSREEASPEEAGTCAAGGPEEAGTCAAAFPPGPDRPIALLAAEPVGAAPRAFLAWALAAGAALVVPAGPELLAWSLAWNRPTHLAIPAADLPALREALLQLEKPRALRRRLRRLRHLLVWTGAAGAAPSAVEAAAWAELGVPLTPWPAG